MKKGGAPLIMRRHALECSRKPYNSNPIEFHAAHADILED
jgi:hypothetical protein